MSAPSKGRRARITVRMPVEVLKRVRKIAKADGSSANDVICHHVDNGTLPFRQLRVSSNWTKEELAALRRHEGRLQPIVTYGEAKRRRD